MHKNTIIDVIPLTRLPLNRQQHFSYLKEGKIPFGTLVSVPLFFRNVEGIVINNRSDFARFGNIKLKKINKIIAENFVTEKQMELAKFISEYYICPLGIVLKMFVPRIVKSKIMNREPTSPAGGSRIMNTELKFKLDNDQRIAIKKIINSHDSGFMIYNSSSNNKPDFYLELARKIIKNKQFLLLLPELNLVIQAKETFEKYFGKNSVAILHSKVAKGEIYNNWQRIKSGEAKIIIGTRMAVAAPYKNLGLITVDDEHDNSFKQWDMNPRYNARTAAEKLAEIHNAKILYSSATPRIETYYKASKEKKILSNGLSNNSLHTEVVDLRKENWNSKKPFKKTILSRALISEMTYALKYKGQILLFINRRGMSNFSVCASCKSVLKCPKCERALIYDTEGFYKCLHCNYKTDIFPTCLKCHGTIFKNIGIGSQTVEKEVKNIFPGASVKRIDFESSQKKSDLEKIFSDRANKKIDIVIGTQMIIKSWNLPPVDLVGIIDADSLFSIPDLWTDEIAFQNIAQVILRAKKNGKALIQTYQPENKIIQMASQIDFANFYKMEIAEREALSYPPFGKIIRLICRDIKKEKVEKEAKKLYDDIQKLTGDCKSLKIFEVQNPLASKIRGRYLKQIIIKLSGAQTPLPHSLLPLLKSLKSNWIIDIDPINLA